jgi:hypothetical protein
LWQKEQRKASSDPARFKQFSPVSPLLNVYRCRKDRERQSSSFLLSPELAF